MLRIENLRAAVADKPILKGISLERRRRLTGKAFFVRHWPAAIEPAVLGVLLLAGALVSFLSPSRPTRSLWVEMGCSGYLLPNSSDRNGSAVSDLKTPKQQADAFRRAARKAGFDSKTSQAAGEAAARLCNRSAEVK
jgi:hypothetical protein